MILIKRLFFSLFIIFSAGVQASINQVLVVSDVWEGSSNHDGSGIYFDLLKLVYEPIGIKVGYLLMPYSRSVHVVKNHQADLWVASYEGELEWAVYPKVEFDSDVVSSIFLKSAKVNWQGALSMTGKNVGYMRGYSYDDYMDVKINVFEVDNRRTGIQMLRKGRFDFFLEDAHTLNIDIDNKKIDLSDMQTKAFLYLKLVMGFQNSDRGKALRDIWDERMHALHQSGELLALYRKHNRVTKHYPFPLK